jgi:ATP-dependent DNA helicase PIF1
MTQHEALEILKTGVNVFLTGEPGSGKTYTINQYVQYLREHDIEPAITASTGIAATHIGGMTIHSWSGIGIKEDILPSDLRKLATDGKYSKRILCAQVLIIDEISMLSQRTLSMVDLVCKSVRKNPSPFGGIQIIFVGDFFQLPPILKNRTLEDPHKQFAYCSSAWTNANPTVCYLTEQHRQDDPAFLGFLSAVRRNNVDEDHFEYIKERMTERASVPLQIPRLFTRNVAVDQLNHERLLKLPGDHRVFVMTQSGNGPVIESLKKGCLSPEQLFLKVGAVVMFTKNNSQVGYANGTVGLVRSLDEEGYPTVEIRGGKTVLVQPMDWKLEEHGKLKGIISQLPLRLAWAITIHKSQGMSMDAAAMDLSDVFEYGQGYVALSRVRRLSGLHLFGLSQRAFEVHPEILKEDNNFRIASEDAQNDLAQKNIIDVKELQESYLLAIGGSINKQEIKKALKKDKGETFSETLKLWSQGKNIEEICQLRSLRYTTILTHIEGLAEAGKISKADTARLLTDSIQDVLPEIYVAFEKLSTEKLTPIFNELDRRYTFEDLRIARILFSAAKDS